MATSQLVTQSSRHMVSSSHGQLVTGQLVTYASRHTVNSSHGQLVTPTGSTRHVVNSSHMRLARQSTRHKWAQNKAVNHYYVLVEQVAPINAQTMTT